MYAILNTEPEPLGEVRPGIPASLETLVRHCLEKNPVARFQSLHLVFDPGLRLAIDLLRGFSARLDHRSLHGAGPHLDNLETRDDRLLVAGVGFSIEPGVYVPGEIGMRTEVNGFVNGRDLLVTPADPQRDLLVV